MSLDLHITRSQLKRPLPSLLLLLGLLLCSYAAGNYARIFLGQRRLRRQWLSAAVPAISTSQGLPGNAVGKLVIPKIGLDAIVIEGTTEHSLLLGPGHLVNSPRPGSAGNVAIAAHRDTFFRNLDLLVPGDSVYLDDGRYKYHYVVAERRVVVPNNTSVLSSSSVARLTLITCYPMRYVGPAPKRLVVVARLQPETSEISLTGSRQATATP